MGDQVRKIFLLIGASFLLSGCSEQSAKNTFSAVSEPKADDTEVSGLEAADDAQDDIEVSEKNQEGKDQMYTQNTKIKDVIHDPVFGTYGRKGGGRRAD